MPLMFITKWRIPQNLFYIISCTMPTIKNVAKEAQNRFEKYSTTVRGHKVTQIKHEVIDSL